MVRGYQRRVVFLKNTGSALFDEAYFLMSERGQNNSPSESEMVKEANRIISENLTSGRVPDRAPTQVFRFIIKQIPAFLLGAILSAVICLFIFW